MLELTLNIVNFTGTLKLFADRLSSPRQEMAFETVPLDEVLADTQKERYNSNNHWTDGKMPRNYHQNIEGTFTSKWIDRVGKPYTRIIVPHAACRWMIAASALCAQIGRISPLFEDELQSFSERYKETVPAGPWFVRSENVSLKYGVHGVGPYTSLRQIAESIVTCPCGHTPVAMLCDDRDLVLYLIEWEPRIDPNLEFRVFVHERRLVAVSQQFLYSTNRVVTTDNWRKYFTALLENFARVRTTIDLPNYTYDIALLPCTCNDLVPYFIEFNSFGRESPAGSAAFHWIVDGDVLYGDGSTPVFRVVIDSGKKEDMSPENDVRRRNAQSDRSV